MLMVKLIMIVSVILPVSIQSDTIQHDEELNDFSDNNHYDDTTSEEIDNSIPFESIPEKYLTSHEHWATIKFNGTNLRPNKFFSSHEQGRTLKNKANMKKDRNNSATKIKKENLDKYTKIAKKDMRENRNKHSKMNKNRPSHAVKAAPNENIPSQSDTNATFSEADEDFVSISNEHKLENRVTEEKKLKHISVNEVNTSIEKIQDTIDYPEWFKDNLEEDDEKTTARIKAKDMEQRTKERPKKEAELKYPYTVSVQRRNSHYASGALLSPKWVISSGREFVHVRESIKLFQIRYGTVNCKRGPTVPIMTIVMHPGYHPPNYDLSLLKMGSEVTNLTPIPLGSKYESGEVFLTTYWPRLIINGTVLPNDAKERFKSHSLRVSKQSIVPYNWCHDELEHDGVNLTFSSFCLKSIVEHHSECLQDPGAPVVFNNALHGISSGWSGSCHDGPRVTVAAAVTQDLMKQWIVGTISG